MQIRKIMILGLGLLAGQVHGCSADKPFIEACKAGHLAKVRVLLRFGADVNEVDSHGHAALLYANARILLGFGADVNTDNEFSSTALMWAADRGHTEVVSLLLARSDLNVNATNIRDSTALMCAASRGHTEVVKELLDHDADINIVDNYGKTASTLAFDNGQTATVEMLRRYPEQKIAWSPERSAWVGTVVRVSRDTYSSTSLGAGASAGLDLE